MRSARLAGVLAASIAGPVWAGEWPAEIAAHQTGIGTHFTTAKGVTLYVYDRDTLGVSTCVDKCIEVWPALAAPVDAKPAGHWTPIERADGTRQWAYRGRPLYTFARDPLPGTTLGDGVQDIWHIAVDLAPRPAGVKFEGTIVGRVAADDRGLTLYVRDKGDCAKECLRTWAPVPAPWAANAVGAWKAVTRSDDGTRQWAYQGNPVYTYVRDTLPGEIKGAGVDKAWRAVVLQPAPALPPGITLQPSDFGPIFADSSGMSLYTVPDLQAQQDAALCNKDCMTIDWKPFVAAADAVPIGNWSAEALPDGRRQWFYRAMPVFLYAHDRKPGDIHGDRYGVGNGFGGFHVIPQITLREEAL